MIRKLLEVEGLRISFGSRTMVEDFGCVIAQGERLGVVGESGSGKSLSARALLGLLPVAATAQARSYEFDGAAFDVSDRKSLACLRGRGIAMVLQDPKFALNPTMTVGAQIAEVCGRSRALDLLARVRLGDPERVFAQHPNALSGGMGQRVMIAMMLAADPKLLIADEPTSALDVTVTNGILALLDELIAERGLSLLFISHDLDLIAAFCDRLLVMARGRVVERLPARDIVRATHPYTRGLLACRPRLDELVKPLPTLDRHQDWALP